MLTQNRLPWRIQQGALYLETQTCMVHASTTGKKTLPTHKGVMNTARKIWRNARRCRTVIVVCVCVRVPVFEYPHNHKKAKDSVHDIGTLLHLHGDGGVDSVVEVQISGAVIGPVCDPQVTVPDPAVQLLLNGILLRQCTQTKPALWDYRGNEWLKQVIHLGYGPLVHKRTNEGLHVFVQLLKHVWLGEIDWRSVVHIQAVGYRVVAACMWK